MGDKGSNPSSPMCRMSGDEGSDPLSPIPPSSSRSRFPFHKFDIEAKALELADQDVEGLGNARFHCSFTLHDRLVNFRSSVHVVGLGCQQFLQDVSGAVGLESPHFHFSESLSTELRFTTQRLLSDKRVGTDRPRMDLVVD